MDGSATRYFGAVRYEELAGRFRNLPPRARRGGGAVTASKGRRSGPADEGQLLLSPAQVAMLLGCSRSTVDRMVADGSLPHVLLRSGRRKKQYGIRRVTLQRWLEKQERK
ncbi:MAG: hypothetical protein DME76_08445 [Verrucomicrobia bacterium]|nr:MAG: hypothetical protein DME76_08445 [Verrucomicrobiota bacterium]